MKIRAISAKFPSKIVTIDDTLDMVEHYSRKSFKGDIKKALSSIKKILVFSGANTRRFLSKNEKPIEIIENAVFDVLKNANCKASEIDLLVYTGIGRGFIEPGGSYTLAKSLGMNSVECFDVLDACMSWTRALNMAYFYLKSNQYKKILIVNGEFNNIADDAFYPGNYKLTNIKQLKWTFPTYTIGDASTATLLTRSKSNAWEWNFSSRTDLADLCTIPTAGYSLFMKKSKYIGKNGPGRFCSFGNEMHQKGTPEVIKIFNKLSVPINDIKMVFPHASSKQAWAYCAKVCGISEKIYYIYPEYGNLVSASVPTGIALALEKKLIKKGDNIVAWVGSAGMSFATVAFKL